MDAIAKRAFVSPHGGVLLLPNKRALVDRLIQRAFTRHVRRRDALPRRHAASRAASCDVGLSRAVAVVNRDAHVLLLAARLAGARGEHLPAEWAAVHHRFVQGAEDRIERDQLRGIAPADIPPRLAPRRCWRWSRATSMRELVLRGGDASESIRVLAELWWRAVYSRPVDTAASVAAGS